MRVEQFEEQYSDKLSDRDYIYFKNDNTKVILHNRATKVVFNYINNKWELSKVKGKIIGSLWNLHKFNKC